MIPYIIIALVALFTQKWFWKSWAICSVLAVIYQFTLGAYLLCQIESVPYAFDFDLGTIVGVTLKTFAFTLGIFWSERFFLMITGRAYWKAQA